jgi:hypothetical protein
LSRPRFFIAGIVVTIDGVIVIGDNGVVITNDELIAGGTKSKKIWEKA